jgi:hypothetical protein
MWGFRWLAAAALAVPAAASAQELRSAPRGADLLLRIEAAALNPDRLDAATMGFGVEAGLAWRGRTMLLARVLRQSGNRNSGADLTSNARDIVSLLVEHTFGPAAMRRQRYFVRAGAGLLFRPRRETSPVATLGVGARYQVYPAVALVGSFEVDLANLIGGAYDTYQWDTTLLQYVAVRTRAKLQPNFGFLLAVEWHPRA